MIDCFISRTAVLRTAERQVLIERLTKPGSEFQQKLINRAQTGFIALCYERGEIVAWARTEKWHGLDTLEAFTMPMYRRRGLCLFAAAGLRASTAFDSDHVATFTESMSTVASRIGLRATQYREEAGEWLRA